MSGQVSQVLEGMDKLNAKVKSFMQKLLACQKDGVNVRNPKIVVAIVNIETVDVTATARSPEILGLQRACMRFSIQILTDEGQAQQWLRVPLYPHN